MNSFERALTSPASRRQFLGGALLTAGLLPLTACTSRTRTSSPTAMTQAILAAEKSRPHTGTTRNYSLAAHSNAIDLGDQSVKTWMYDGNLPGKTLRANVGDELAVTVKNDLPHPTSIHWHGLAIRNDMDGVDPVTSNIGSGKSFRYRFSAPNPGTYWFHPHVGVQTDYGLYAPLIIDDPSASADYDLEWIIVLDDWTDGVGPSPEDVLATLRKGSSMSGMNGMGSSGGAMSGMSGMAGMETGVGSSTALGGDVGDVKYPLYLVNGRNTAAPTEFRGKPQRVRLRLINAGADTAFRVALSGHSTTVTHTDGFPVTPRQVDALLMGMGERYDAIITLGDGVFQLAASAEGKAAQGRAVVRTGAGATPLPTARPKELDGRLGVVDLFRATAEVRLPTRAPDTTLTAVLGGKMSSYAWTINGRTYDTAAPLPVSLGQRVRMVLRNDSMMWHPIHLHGHTLRDGHE
jgi:FtsP/CotA-like multicopper oxidase with cupredoxin domain